MILGISGLTIDENGTPVGSAGSGKDFVADLLVREFPWVKLAFADEIKRIARDLYAFTDEQLWGPSAKRNEPDLRYPRDHDWVEVAFTDNFTCVCCGLSSQVEEDKQCYLTPRFVLQQIGTETGRRCYLNTWVDLAVRNAQTVIGNPNLRYDQKSGVYGILSSEEMTPIIKGMAIPDVRYKNEMDGLRSQGAKIVRIKRRGKALAGSAGAHSSEREALELPDSTFDYVLDNNGTAEDLRQQLLGIVNHA